MSEEYEYWDVNTKNLGRRKAADLLVALVAVNGRLHDSYFRGPGDANALYYCPNYFQGFLRVSIPKGKEALFEKFSGQKLVPKPVPNI